MLKSSKIHEEDEFSLHEMRDKAHSKAKSQSQSRRNQGQSSQIELMRIDEMDENRSVSSRAVPIIIPNFVINSCRNKLFCSFKHLHIKANKKFIVVFSFPTGTSDTLRRSFLLDGLKLDKCRHLLTK